MKLTRYELGKALHEKGKTVTYAKKVHSFDITLDNGAVFHLLDRDGKLEITTDNQVAVFPAAGNQIILSQKGNIYER